MTNEHKDLSDWQFGFAALVSVGDFTGGYLLCGSWASELRPCVVTSWHTLLQNGIDSKIFDSKKIFEKKRRRDQMAGTTSQFIQSTLSEDRMSQSM
jgi:hypothetical protein